MPKICILGNSHLGALAQSVSGSKAFSEAGYEVVYWGAAGTLFGKIAYADGQLISPAPERSKIISSGLYGHLPLSEFDGVLFYGMAVSLSNIALQITKRLKTIEPLSQAFVAEVLSEQIGAWWEMRTGRALMQAVIDAEPNKRYVFTPDPLIAQNDSYLSGVQDAALLSRVLDALYAHCQGWCAARNIDFYRQNDLTWSPDRITTDTSFSTDSVKMEAGKPHPEDDFVHMNGRYGDIILADILALLEADQPTVRAAG